MASTAKVFQLRISLDHINPPIWRRVIVPSSMRLRRLHGVVQATMGWTNSHLYHFRQDGRIFSRPNPDIGEYVEDDSTFRVDHLLMSPGDTMTYEYDMGDSWNHTVMLEEVVVPDSALKRAQCLAGARACPPEDCGGVMGYQNFLEAMLDPFHPEHRAMRAWVGGDFDPEAFDLVKANLRLRR